jgi:CheY-like chemotaxis protein
MTADRKTVLCIDDYRTSLAGWCLYLQSAGYLVETAYNPQEGLQLFGTLPVDVVLLDYAMPEIDGGEVAATMKQIKPDVPIVMLSGVSHIPEHHRAHVDALIVKGEQPTVVLQKIDELLNPSQRVA